MSEPVAVPVDPKKVRDLKIKSGIVKRLAKEKISYEKECEAHLQKENKMREESVEEYYIKKQEELLDESRKMVTDCERRLISARGDLSKTLEAEKDLKDTEEYKAALVILDEAKPAAKK